MSVRYEKKIMNINQTGKEKCHDNVEVVIGWHKERAEKMLKNVMCTWEEYVDFFSFLALSNATHRMSWDSYEKCRFSEQVLKTKISSRVRAPDTNKARGAIDKCCRRDMSHPEIVFN